MKNGPRPFRLPTSGTATAGLLIALCFCLFSSSLRAQSFAQFEARHTHPIGLTPNKLTLLALNSPDARLSVFDISNPANPEPVLLAEIPVGLEPVSVRARTDDEVWVVNEVSDSISVVSLSRGLVVDTLRCSDEPADVVFAQGNAYVTCARNNLVRIFDVTTRVELGTIPLKGRYPRSLAVDSTGTYVYVAFQLSGNRTTILPTSAAPAPPVPTNPNLPPAPGTALIVAGNDPRISHVVLDQDVAVISVASNAVTRYISDVGTILFDVTPRPGTDELWVANTEALNLTRFEPALKGHFIDNRLSRITLSNGETTPFDLNPGIDYGLLPNPTAQSNALAQPTALVFKSDGSEGWVAAFASDWVARFDAVTGTILNRVDVRPTPQTGTNGSHFMRGPRGLALHEGRQQLFMLNKLGNSISVINTVNANLITEVPTGSSDPTPTSVKEGRGFLFDARLSGNGTASCGSCHVDGDLDGLAWDLGNPDGEMSTVIGANLAAHDTTPRQRSMHPMKGPMVTQTLRGLAPGQLLHWRGDRATLRDFNPTFRDLMGGSLIAEADIDAMKAYLDTLRHHPNPNRNTDNSLPAIFLGGNPTRGRTVYSMHNNHCAVCHPLPSGSDNNIDDIRNIAATQPIKTPPLQTVYQRAVFDSRPGATNVAGFGLSHDGTGSIHAFPTMHFYELDEMTGADFADVTAFLMCFDSGTAPAVGYSRTVTFTNSSQPLVVSDVARLETQSRSTLCDLVVRGKIAGRWRNYLYDRVVQLYRSDAPGEPLRNRNQMIALPGPDDALTFMGVPVGLGERLSIDRDGDGVSNFDETSPLVQFGSLPVAMTLRWKQAGWLLEEATNPSGAWQPNLQLRTADGEYVTTQAVFADGQRYFRLRRTW